MYWEFRQTSDEAHDGRMNLLTVFEDDVKVDLGKPSDESGAAAVKALERAIEDQKNGLVDAIVAAPINESTFKKNGKVFNGQSALLESELKSGAKTLRMIIGKKLRLAFATTDIPLKEVSRPQHSTILCDATSASLTHALLYSRLILPLTRIMHRTARRQ